MAEQVAMSNVSEMDKGVVEERIVRKVESSPLRLPGDRSRSRSRERKRRDSRGRRSGSRRRSRSRSRRRSRSRSRRRSRSRSRRRSRSRYSRKRSRSRERRGKERRSSNPQLNTLQREVMGMQDETRRLQKEREAIEKEKAMLQQEAEKNSSCMQQNKTTSSVPSWNEFNGMESVMDNVLEAVGGGDRGGQKKYQPASPLAKPSKIIPGAQTFEDLEAFIRRKKEAKMEELKKKK